MQIHNKNIPDQDPIETQEWRDALDSVIEFEGKERAEFIIKQLLHHASQKRLSSTAGITTAYLNTLDPEEEARLPEKEVQLMEQLMNYLRWNAIMMVMRAGKVDSSLGGHIASYASAALLFEVGLNYFFHAPSETHGGDLVFFQGHSSPGIYARAFLEGRLTEAQIDGFRQEFSKSGISSYPHPWLMKNFWQFATVSMGLGPLMAIYQAQFLKYLNARGLAETENRKVWAFCGDGEMSEPESMGVLNFAARERLDNLIFVINCNLQRLDGPVFGNGQIIQEYEGVFRGAGWNVIKVIWGSGWEKLFSEDKSGLLYHRISELLDGEFQNYSAKDPVFFREHFFGKYPELLALVAKYSDAELKALLIDGGHDPQKIYAAYSAAIKHRGQPTVILAKTIKGFGMGKSGEGLNVTHQTKKISEEDLNYFITRFKIPIQKETMGELPYYTPEKNSAVMQYLQEKRKALGGYLPARMVKSHPLSIPALAEFSALLQNSEGREFSTTMALSRILSTLLRNKTLKEHIVPILVDESRTFGVEGLFRQIGIYSPLGQLYEPEDKKQLMYYREDQKGQLLQEGLNEAGGMSAWIAAATSYANNNLPMIPFYIYYSMFGFQRVGDLAWAAGDMRARGFIIGGTAGRTTINGEGLQHQDGHNLLMFSVIPNCISYDPTFAYEMAVIVHNGLKRMVENEEDVYFYITGMNENYTHPAMPEGVEENIIKGMYLFQSTKAQSPLHVQLMGSGTILREVIKASEILSANYGVSADVWSVTSFNELRRDCEHVARFCRLHPEEEPKQSHVEKCLENRPGPVIAATDYMKIYADQIRQSIQAPYYVLGTDGFGRSDTREALRDFFEVDAKMIVYTALKALFDQNNFTLSDLMNAKKELGIDSTRPDPITQ